MPRVTRRSLRRSALQALPLDPNILVHVFGSLSLHHGSDALAPAAAVCRRWRERVEGSQQLEDDPENVVGELRSGDKPYRFDRPHDAAYLADGDICVADCDNFRLQVYTRDGLYVREIRLSGGTSCPTGVATLGDDHLVVVEHGAHRVCKLSQQAASSSQRLATAGAWGGGDGELRHPWGVATLGARSQLVVVTDSGNERVCVFGPILSGPLGPVEKRRL